MKRHPTANRPLIDYKVALLLQPLSVAGTIIGFLLNTVSACQGTCHNDDFDTCHLQVFPSWLILVLLVITLIITSVLTTRKGINVRRKEHQQRMVLIPELNTPMNSPQFSTPEEPFGFNPPKSELEPDQHSVELDNKSAVDWSARDMIDLIGHGPRTHRANAM